MLDESQMAISHDINENNSLQITKISIDQDVNSSNLNGQRKLKLKNKIANQLKVPERQDRQRGA